MFVGQFLEVIVISTTLITPDGVPVIVKLSVVPVTVKKIAAPAGVSGLAFTVIVTPAVGTFVIVIASGKSGPVAAVCKLPIGGTVVAEIVAWPVHGLGGGGGVVPPPPPLLLQLYKITIELIIKNNNNRKIDFIDTLLRGSN